MEYLLMLVSIFFAVTNNCLLHRLPSSTFRTPGDIYFYNGCMNGGGVLLMAIFSLITGDFAISWESVIFGVIYGVLLVAFLLSKSLAMVEGPVSLTTLIGCSCFVICTIFGAIYAKETIDLFQIIGMVLLMIGLILCVNPKKGDQPLTPRWFMYVAFFFITGGLVGILYKIFGLTDSGHMFNSMLLFAALTASTLFLVLSFVINRKAKAPKPSIPPAARPSLLLCSFVSCVYIRMNLSLSNMIPSAIFFPVCNGGIILLASLLGIVLFKERLQRIQMLGVALGLLAIVLNGCSGLLMRLILPQ